MQCDRGDRILACVRDRVPIARSDSRPDWISIIVSDSVSKLPSRYQSESSQYAFASWLRGADLETVQAMFCGEVLLEEWFIGGEIALLQASKLFSFDKACGIG